MDSLIRHLLLNKEIDVEDDEDIGDVINVAIDETVNRAMANYENETENITDNEPDFEIKKCESISYCGYSITICVVVTSIMLIHQLRSLTGHLTV